MYKNSTSSAKLHLKILPPLCPRRCTITVHHNEFGQAVHVFLSKGADGWNGEAEIALNMFPEGEDKPLVKLTVRTKDPEPIKALFNSLSARKLEEVNDLLQEYNKKMKTAELKKEDALKTAKETAELKSEYKRKKREAEISREESEKYSKDKRPNLKRRSSSTRSLRSDTSSAAAEKECGSFPKKMRRFVGM